MTPPRSPNRRRYKILFLGVITFAALIIITSAWSIRHDARFSTQSIASIFKHYFYEASFHVSNSIGTANVYQTTATRRVLAGEPAHSVPVLVYHGVVSAPDGSTINVTTEQFKEQMFSLKRAGYTTLSLRELYEYGAHGAPLPVAPIVITFDDGRADSFYNGDPILDAVDFTASMYVITKFTQGIEPGGYYLASSEIERMAKTGRWEIGSHSNEAHGAFPIDDAGNTGNYYSHHLWVPAEARLETDMEYVQRITNDFRTSQDYLQDLIGTEVRTLAFPFGDFGQTRPDAETRTKTVIGAASNFYDLMLYQHEPGAYFSQYARKEQSNGSLLVRRINIDNRWDTETLLSILANGDHKPLPYFDDFTTDRGWLNVWGDHALKDGRLSMQAEPSSSGGSTILDGSALWRDYEVRVEATSPNRTGFVTWVRFQNDNNNAGCNFGTHFVHAEQTLRGEKRVLSGVQLPDGNIPEGSFVTTARVEGRTLICSLNGTEIVRTEFLDPTLDVGGTGIKIWDATLGKSNLEVEQFSVTEIPEALTPQAATPPPTATQ